MRRRRALRNHRMGKNARIIKRGKRERETNKEKREKGRERKEQSEDEMEKGKKKGRRIGCSE